MAEADGPGGARAGGVRVRYRCSGGAFAEVPLNRLDVSEVVDGLPVREFRSYRGRRHYSGWFWSASMGRLVVYESRLELARLLLADFDRSVVAFAAQPFQLVGEDGGRVRRHVPDVLLMHADGSVTVVDVKASSRLEDPLVVAQFAWTGRLCAERGWRFEVWSGVDPRYLENVRFLAGYRRRSLIDEGLVPAVLECVGDQQTIGGIERVLAGAHAAPLVRPVVLHLLWSGRLVADLSSPLGTATAVRQAGEAG
ncbi:TnsA-like heteromeric transposase endonuclease subunit [Streptomyces silvisoli]|uniref:TnsA-like heteromeric transposase endonuclease subunit n=1 Tax=Streptomyces silvisoli TaxID=3034235 RepID=A0ABT5ZRJ8_9ACTN|nr:TnsA-like heteromeric transposase endonuclease subunit [Streptomyces silvisoli]MDF3292445.1 TnsA-like heteromeric transposase endonuclease subunit [Streptomyces silvisoli]